MNKLFIFFFTLGLSISGFAQNGKKLFKPIDFLKIKNLREATISPDEKWVAYSLSEVDTATDKRVSHLYMQSLTSADSVQLTHGSNPASSPKWSPDNKFLAFLSSRDSKTGSQVWVLNRSGGEAKKLTDIKGDLNSFEWSPDSKKLVLLIQDPENKEKKEPKSPLPIIIDRYHFKQDIDGYLQNGHTHLYLFEIAVKKLDTLTHGNTDDAEPAWSPDGKKIAFVSNHTTDPDRNSNTDIFTVDAVKGGKILQLTTWKGHDNHPRWSPDGKKISLLRSTSDADYLMYDQDILAIMDADGSNTTLLTTLLDRPVSDQVFTKDGKNLGFLIADDRKVILATYNFKTRKIIRQTNGENAIVNIEALGLDNWVITMTTRYLPAELYAFEKGKTRKLTQHQNWLKEYKLAHVAGFQSSSKDGTAVSGILYTPDSIRSKKLPFILFIHGGPVAQDEYGFDITRQALACAGYAVAAVNYRGSSGRGLAYCKAIYADWGNKEVSDLLGAVDKLVKEGIADPAHLGIGGWSYGGILTDYTIASDTRFKAGASGAGSALQTSMYGVDQYVLQYENELGAPWKNQEKWISLSYPFFHADRIKTPVLFMSGLKDFNVPTIGSEQMYMALKSQNIPTQLVLYPNQYHGVSVPSYQLDKLERYIKWFDTYLK